MRTIAIILFTAFSLVAGFAQPKKVVIETTIGTGVEEEVKEVFMDALGNGLNLSGKFIVLENRQEYFQKIQGEIEAQEGGMINDGQLVELGKALGAELVVYPKITKSRTKYFIVIKMIDISSGQALKTLPATSADEDNIFDKAIELAQMLAEDKSVGSQTKTIESVYSSEISCDVDTRDHKPKEYSSAKRICEKRDGGWRLPTKEEMRALFHAAKIRGTVFGNPFKRRMYWTEDKRNNFSAYVLEYPNLSPTYVSTTSECSFRCVRDK